MTILITGTNRGIGADLAAGYRAAGHTVIATARDASAAHQLDVTDPAAHKALAASLGDTPLDLLICNAGVFLDKQEPLDTGYAPELWAQTFAVNVTGVFLTVQALLPNLRRAASPKIAIIASQLGSSERKGSAWYIYRASKAAAINLGRSLSVDLAPEGIAVGIYHPGWVRTEMGGSEADISTTQAVTGLMARFDHLSLATTGCFETWDGQTHPF